MDRRWSSTVSKKSGAHFETRKREAEGEGGRGKKKAQRVVGLTQARERERDTCINKVDACVCVLSCVLMRCVWLGYLPVRLSPRCCGHRKEGLGCCLLRMSPVRCGGCGPLAFQTIGDHYLPEREKVRMVIKVVRLAATRPRSRSIIHHEDGENFFFFLSFSTLFFSTLLVFPMSENESPPFLAATSPPLAPLLSTRYQPTILTGRISFVPYALESGRLCFRYL